MSFEYIAQIDLRNTFFKAYDSRLRNAYYSYKRNSSAILPVGTFRFDNRDENDLITLVGLIILPDSPLYPSATLDKEVYKIVAQGGLDISIIKKDLSKIDGFDFNIPNLSFETQIQKPIITFWANDSILELKVDKLVPDKHSFAWRNKGGIETISDLSESLITLNFSDLIVNQLNDEAFNISKKYLIKGFSVNVSNYIFSTYQLCNTPFDNYIQYYLNLPENMYKTQLNLECK